MRKKLFTFLLFWTIGILTAFAQVENPATWSYSEKSLGNGEYELTLKAELKPGWTIYSMYTPEGGPMQTSLNFEAAGKGIELLGKATENELHKEYDPIFEVDVWHFNYPENQSDRSGIDFGKRNVGISGMSGRTVCHVRRRVNDSFEGGGKCC